MHLRTGARPSALAWSKEQAAGRVREIAGALEREAGPAATGVRLEPKLRPFVSDRWHASGALARTQQYSQAAADSGRGLIPIPLVSGSNPHAPTFRRAGTL